MNPNSLGFTFFLPFFLALRPHFSDTTIAHEVVTSISTYKLYIMKTLRILALFATAIGGVALSSCGCCTGVEGAPALRPLPQFNDIATPGAVINYAK